ncbi:hypothetical protein Y1Q_0019238 [Alligator mississippiensis]|uniref:Uncharacterized protein n=1 Tax=Alligator mississippiensis TaxID=8496 RepID=A0A151MQT8_ALLMI|nr:hypothetical protein Y1Q_0019238 [Alligator mississippiensis]
MTGPDYDIVWEIRDVFSSSFRAGFEESYCNSENLMALLVPEIKFLLRLKRQYSQKGNVPLQHQTSAEILFYGNRCHMEYFTKDMMK